MRVRLELFLQAIKILSKFETKGMQDLILLINGKM